MCCREFPCSVIQFAAVPCIPDNHHRIPRCDGGHSLEEFGHTVSVTNLATTNMSPR